MDPEISEGRFFDVSSHAAQDIEDLYAAVRATAGQQRIGALIGFVFAIGAEEPGRNYTEPERELYEDIFFGGVAELLMKFGMKCSGKER